MVAGRCVPAWYLVGTRVRTWIGLLTPPSVEEKWKTFVERA
jgi:hypothetical protein